MNPPPLVLRTLENKGGFIFPGRFCDQKCFATKRICNPPPSRSSENKGGFIFNGGFQTRDRTDTRPLPGISKADESTTSSSFSSSLSNSIGPQDFARNTMQWPDTSRKQDSDQN